MNYLVSKMFVILSKMLDIIIILRLMFQMFRMNYIFYQLLSK